MKHKFQDPMLKQVARFLIELDTSKSPDSQYAIPECETLTSRTSDYGVVLNEEFLASLTDIANKESVRRGKPVGILGGELAYHPEVLDAVLEPLLTSERV